MRTKSINYVIYIATTAEQLWQTLTSSDALKNNWGNIESSWAEGSEVKEVNDAGQVLWTGTILRNNAPRSLSYTMGVGGVSEPATEITFDLSPPATKIANATPVVRLSVTQSGFPLDSKLMGECARAWSEILSSFKSFIETGHPLGFRWH